MLQSFWEYFREHFREPFNIILEPFQTYVGTILKTCVRPSYDHFGIVCIMLVTFRNHYRTILGPVYGHVIPTYKAFLDMCSHLENILGICLSFWGKWWKHVLIHSGTILGSFSDHCKDILKLSKGHHIFCWVLAKCFVGFFEGYFRNIIQICWDHFEVIFGQCFGPFLDHYKCFALFERCWNRFRHISVVL